MVYFIIFVLSIIGVFLCAYIYSAKKKGKVLVCAIGTDCDKVVHSKYSAILGIPLENIGMFYYSSFAILSGLIIFGIKSVFVFDLNFFLMIVSAMGAFFSLVFIYIQTVLIKEWCEYCLVSVGLSLIIFLIKFFN